MRKMRVTINRETHKGEARAVSMLIAATFIMVVNPLFPVAHPDDFRESTQGLFSRDAAINLDSSRDYFIENRGQVNDVVRFYSGGNPSVAFRDDGVMFIIKERVNVSTGDSDFTNPLNIIPTLSEGNRTSKSIAYILRFDGANKVSPIGMSRLSFDSNFLIGSNPISWFAHVPGFGEIVYENLYEGVDMIFRLGANGIKYEFVVHSGFDPDVINLRLEGIETLEINDGALLIGLPIGQIREEPPYSYQNNGKDVSCGFARRGLLSYGFDCVSWDDSDSLVIDPLIYSTFIGGSEQDGPSGYSRIAVDSLGYAYIAGQTDSSDFPTTVGAFDTTLAFRDVFVAKLSPFGDGLIYSTYLGGGGEDQCRSIAMDRDGNVYVVGLTSSDDYPVTPGAFNTTFGGGVRDGFITKLNVDGDSLIYSTYIGGTEEDIVMSIALDQTGNAYITGSTASVDFPTTIDAYRQIFAGGTDAFATRLSADGSRLIYSTYFGGNGSDTGASIALDYSGAIVFMGWTFSSDFPITPGAFDTSYSANGDFFITKIDPLVSMPVFSTFLGGSGVDAFSSPSIASDASGDIYVTGGTASADFPATSGSFDRTFNGGTYDAFISKLNASGDRIVYSTFLGGASNDGGSAIAVDSEGRAYVVGTTSSADFPTTPRAFATSQVGNADMFVTRLSQAGDAIEYSSYLGGTAWEQGTSIAIDYEGMIYAVGNTDSIDFPTTPGAFDRSLGGTRDTSVTKLNPNAFLDPPDLVIGPVDLAFNPSGPVTEGTQVVIDATVHNLGGSNASDVVARFHDGPPSGSNQIGADQIIPFIPYFTGTGLASVTWTSEPSGVHDICVFADPNHIINESHEDNNMACVSVQVLSPPDLAPISIATVPSTPIPEGTLSRVNVAIANTGDLSAGGFDLPLFDDSNGNLAPDPGEDIGMHAMAGIAGHSQSYGEFSWSAAPAGAHSICACADPPPGTVTESNETNNVMCIDVLVQPGPVLRPDYIPVSPFPLPPIKAGLSSPVSLSIEVRNQGNGTATNDATVTFREQSSPPFSTFILSPLAPAAISSRFTATWTSLAIPGSYLVSVDVDHDDNVTEWDETNNVYTWTIEIVSGSVTSLVIGNPNYTSPAIVTYVRSTTLLDFSVLDQSGLGIRNTTYTIDGGSPVNYTATGTFFLPAEGVHTIEWRSLDWAGNLEDVSSMDLIVDDTPPATAILIGEPKYLTGGIYVNSSTPLTLSAIDGGVGSNSTFYRLWGGSWSQWRDYSTSFNLAGRDGTWYVEFLSFDYLGNMEALQNETLILDDTPPVTTISPAVPFTLAATDSGCGLNVTMYRIDSGSWTVYTGNFALSEGEHTIYYYSIDNLGNVEQERSLVVRPPVEVEVNYKPIVALIFAVILLVAGIWSSKRRPRKGGKDRTAVMKAFMMTSMPFVLAEAATGISSYVTGQLSIPPALGFGTAVDLGVLMAGLVVALARALKAEEMEAESTNEPESR
jgi:hypothetical protein